MRVGKLITFAIGDSWSGKKARPELKPGAPLGAPPKSSDDLEVALELPLRHRRLELPALPVAGAHVVIDELRAEDLAHFLAAREGFGRRSQGRWQRLGLAFVAVARRLRRNPPPPLPPPEAPPDP